MRIEAEIKVNGVVHTHIHIELEESVYDTTKRYWYEAWTPGRRRALASGMIEHDSTQGVRALVMKVLGKTAFRVDQNRQKG